MASNFEHSFSYITTVEMKCLYDYTVVAPRLELLVITLPTWLTESKIRAQYLRQSDCYTFHITWSRHTRCSMAAG